MNSLKWRKLGLTLVIGIIFLMPEVVLANSVDPILADEKVTPLQSFIGEAAEVSQEGFVDLGPLLRSHGVNYAFDSFRRSASYVLDGCELELKNGVPFLRIGRTVEPLSYSPVINGGEIRVSLVDVELVLTEVLEVRSADNQIILSEDYGPWQQGQTQRWGKFWADYEGLYTLENIQGDLDYLEMMYPGLVRTSVLGYTPDGNPINELVIGTGDAEPVIIFGSIHGREYHTAKYLMFEVFEMVRAWDNNQWYMGYDLRSFLNTHTLRIIPVMNPDGMNIAQKGFWVSRNLQYLEGTVDHRTWKADAQMINPNRNFDFLYSGGTDNLSQRYGQHGMGTAPEESVVVRITADYLKATDFNATLQLHEKGKIIYWSDSYNADRIPGNRWFAEQVRLVNGYPLMPVTSAWGNMQGGLENWVRGAFNRPSLCIEMSRSTGDVPNPETLFKGDVFDENRGLLVRFADVARQWKFQYGQ